jgi:hypothetical protein
VHTSIHPDEEKRNNRMQYRKRPIVVEAEQWLGWSKTGEQEERLGLRTHTLSLIRARIETLEGGHDVLPGDWIITGAAGERYPCKPEIFTATYECVEEPLVQRF